MNDDCREVVIPDGFGRIVAKVDSAGKCVAATYINALGVMSGATRADIARVERAATA